MESSSISSILPHHNVEYCTWQAMSISSAAYHVEACVIGAGVVGIATASALAMAGKEILILEREASIGSGHHHETRK